MNEDTVFRNRKIKDYFHLGYSYQEIVDVLETRHNFAISIRHLKRILKDLNLYRRRHHVGVNVTIINITREVGNSGSSFGYRLMHQKLRSKGINVHRETVRLCILQLDPDGVQQRTNRRFRRRVYISAGPNFLWHIDGYDKLKPFDGFSRKILWLFVSKTNNDPKVISSYFVKCIETLNFVPRCIRADRRTENVIVCGAQRFLRRNCNDDFSGKRSFLYGPSTRNQRIESWWSIFRKTRMNWWINFFKDLCDLNLYDPSIEVQVECMRFCFISLLQTELDEMLSLWNSHRIRNVRNAECPPGKPDVLFHTARTQGVPNYSFPFSIEDLNLVKEHTTQPCLFGCSEEYSELFFFLMREHGLSTPNSVDSAKTLFLRLTWEIQNVQG